MNVTAFVQARLGSRRLPGKVLRPIAGKPMLWHIVNRLRQVPGIAQTAVITSNTASDAPLTAYCRDRGIPCFTGSEHDVLDRYRQAAARFNADPVLRVTADCPLIDPRLIQRLIDLFQSEKLDHAGIACGADCVYRRHGRFPDGLDAECVSRSALERCWAEATDPRDREHVTPYIWRAPTSFRHRLLTAPGDHGDLRWTVDTPEDLDFVHAIYNALDRPDRCFGLEDTLEFLEANPEISEINRRWIGREGYDDLWRVEETVETQTDKEKETESWAQ